MLKDIKTIDLTDIKIAGSSRNKTALAGVCSMNVIIAIAYYIEVLKGARTVGSYMIVAAGCIIPCVAALIFYFRKKETLAVRYITSVGFALLYGYIMFTTTTNLAFSYVVIIYIILAVYSDTKLSVSLGGYGILLNIALVVKKKMDGNLTPQQITETEIMLLCLLLACMFSLMAQSKLTKISRANIEQAGKEKEQSENLLGMVLKMADSVADSVSLASDETAQLKHSIEVTKGAMEELTGGANDAVAAILRQQKKTDEINIQIEEVEEITECIAADVKDAEENLINSTEIMDALVRQMENSEAISKQVAKEMEELKTYADRMQEIMTLISGVASQTGLLALNASIEAARAGEAGRGFAVVASEISSLASQTSAATGNINGLIINISKSLTETAASVEGLLENNKAQSGYVNNTSESFHKIHNNTQNIVTRMSKLKEKVEIVSEANKVICESVENISAVTEEVTAGANETFEGSKLNLQSVAKVTEIIADLNKNTEELKNAKIK